MSVNVKNLLASLRDVSGNEYASLSKDGTLGDSDSYISTGSYLLNMQISGDLFKGLSGSSVLCLGGESSCVTKDTLIEVEIEDYMKKTITIGEVEKLIQEGKQIKVKTLNNEYTNILEFVNKGILKTFETTLSNGYKIKTTADHRFFSNIGWVKQKDINKKKQRLMCDDGKYYDVVSTKKIDDAEIVDIRVEHPEECYFGNGILNHNTGKTFFSISLINSFLKNHANGIVLIFDSENAINKQRLEMRGCDLERINYYPVSSLFQFHVECNKIMDELNSKYKRGDVEILIVLDSLGNLPSSKEIADTKKGEQKQDMTRTKEVRSIFRQLTVKLAKLSMRMIITNHTYTDIMSVGQQVMAGGGGIKYAADTILTLTKAKDRATDGSVIGNTITSTAIKARDSKENTKVKHLLSYTHGLHPYYGLIDYAVMDDSGVPWSKKGTKIQIGDDKDAKTYFAKYIYKHANKFFTKDVLEKLNVYMKKFFTYGTPEEENEIFEDSDDTEDTKEIKVSKK